MSTKLGVTENFVSSLYLLIQSSTLKKCIEHCLTALATLLHVDFKLFTNFTDFWQTKNWQILDSKITTWYTALSHNLPTDRKSKVPSSNKCNKNFGQSCRENFWTPNKSDAWGQNTPFCHDIPRAKTTILPVNKILMRFSAWNSFHLPRQFVFEQLYALFCAFCWEPLANKWHFASCNIYTLLKLSLSKAHWNGIAF